MASPAAQRFARAGIRRVTVSAQRAAIGARIGNGIDDLFARSAEKLRRDSRGCDAHEQHVVQADAIETIFQREHALDFVRLESSP